VDNLETVTVVETVLQYVCMGLTMPRKSTQSNGPCRKEISGRWESVYRLGTSVKQRSGGHLANPGLPGKKL